MMPKIKSTDSLYQAEKLPEISGKFFSNPANKQKNETN